MGKRTTLIAVSALALLLACIILAVVRLYRPVGGNTASAAPVEEGWSILRAIPSDAAAVAVFDGSAAAASLLADSCALLQGLFAPETPAFMAYLQALGRSPMAVSLHNSGAMVPLVAAETPDSTLAPLAAKAGLKLQREGGILLASRSETFLGAGARALQEGHSLLDTRQLQDLIGGRSRVPAVLLVSHSHAQKLLQIYAGKAFQQHAGFVKNLTAWSAWRIQSLEKEEVLLVGESLPGEKAASFLADYNGTPAQRPEFPELLPYYTSEALSLPIPDLEAFFDARRKQEDGRGKLLTFSKALKARGGRPLSPEAWFTSLQPREAVYASFKDESGADREAVLIRCGRDQKFGEGSPNPYTGCLATVLGPEFDVQDSVCATVGKWSLFADTPTLKILTAKQDYTLKNRLSDASVELPNGFVAYASLSDNSATAGRVFDKRLAQPLADMVNGSGFAPATASLDLSGSRPAYRIRLNIRPRKESKEQVLSRDTTVVVPGGRFPVTNSFTGKTNYLYQNAHGAICLQDENGKDVWGIPFKDSFCGRVQTIDYYNNKKLQFLFCAADKLYVIDRLGRWVSGFPVSLPKPVLLGPDVYDFSGAGAYTVMVLHRDNSLERYNLHGQKPEGWKGIKAPETVKNLPELVEKDGERYWVVQTSVRQLVYPFEGGDPIKKKL